MSNETLYERLGGEPAIGAVVNEFYDRVLDDDRVNHYFDDVDMADQRSHQTKFLSAVTGGPMQYEGEEMATAHEELAITDAEFEVVATHLDEALRAFDVDDADREAVMEAVAGFEDDVVGDPGGDE
ncbi:group 1 truncated hemoglobin [Halorubrum sp. SS5]|uniref:Group 1 truncated hemoglobin n=1 Tax=Halorubrum salinarum TaxID=2739057 RepID=A0A7D4CS91_9EURY|nr:MULTISPECIES: group 1 truncated hemoglobin [Halorubrum]QKG92279.1 group 1 truncated hemoglobin [Halorubrum salinarum]TKX57203.1 group 1 truncated hemoglobin [Halorubrum sp. SS7]TKX85996.1 group 1 truncated hemoglobin [Halorubrum sp. SS5]